MKLLNGIFRNNEIKDGNQDYETYYSHGGLATRKHSFEDREDLNSGEIKYKCPMGCEDDKTYDTPGSCPVCNMKLVPVEIIIHEPTGNRIVK